MTSNKNLVLIASHQPTNEIQMAHEITLRASKFAEFAFTGSRTEIWHGLGQELSPDASIETWRTQAGMDWDNSCQRFVVTK